MQAYNQKLFIQELSASIVADLCAAIDNGKVPENWDGHELRALLADRHKQSAAMSLVIREPRRTRAREYHNAVLVNNL